MPGEDVSVHVGSYCSYIKFRHAGQRFYPESHLLTLNANSDPEIRNFSISELPVGGGPTSKHKIPTVSLLSSLA